ncbi:MAG: Asp23/Gls24 family envelope stress response protein [Candidatus Omnitrophota bacterium]
MTEENKIDFGSIQIHKKVLADIAYSTIHEIEGVSLIPGDLMTRVMDFCGKTSYPGISVHIDPEGEVMIEVKILVHYGINIPDIARQVQDAIRTRVEKIAEINLKDIHVNIQGIERGKS